MMNNYNRYLSDCILLARATNEVADPPIEASLNTKD
jgi:hypothetical protein